MIKYLSLFILLNIAWFLNAHAQDTLKKSTPQHHSFPPFRQMLDPFEVRREHAYHDSIRAIKYPEGKHPTIYFDAGFGPSFAAVHGIQGNYSLNYQYDRSLFTFRSIGSDSYEDDPKAFINLFPSQNTRSLSQYALLYGWRFKYNYQQAYSFSLGIADDSRTVYSYDSNNHQTKVIENYAGLPFEANYQFYTRRFGVSFGLKLSGDISQHSFIGFGVDMGLGFHYSHP